jgi:hypothetical protein
MTMVGKAGATDTGRAREVQALHPDADRLARAQQRRIEAAARADRAAQRAARADRSRRRAPNRDIYGVPVRVLMAAGLVMVAMLLAGIALAGLGLGVLSLSGGAATDTGLVILLGAFAVTDFWGGGLVRTLTAADTRTVAVAWGVARMIAIVIGALLSTRMLMVAPVQLVIAVAAAAAGAHVAALQARLTAEDRAQ